MYGRHFGIGSLIWAIAIEASERRRGRVLLLKHDKAVTFIFLIEMERERERDGGEADDYECKSNIVAPYI